MVSNEKANNQYYGKYRECCVVAHLNNEEVQYHENFFFTEEERKELYYQGKIIADFIGNHKAEYCGNHTMDAAGDILLDTGENIEIKTVSAGTGTYYNTSIYYFEKFGFDFKKYMDTFGLYKALEESFGDFIKISKKNKSPVSMKHSSLIRHEYSNIYINKIVPIDILIRESFTKDLVEYFITNPEKVYEFISDMINKNSETSKKTSPDRLIVYNYTKDTIKEINLKNFTSNITNVRSTAKGLVIGNIRFAFGWSNGNGLNNPTIRVFLENKEEDLWD